METPSRKRLNDSANTANKRQRTNKDTSNNINRSDVVSSLDTKSEEQLIARPWHQIIGEKALKIPSQIRSGFNNAWNWLTGKLNTPIGPSDLPDELKLHIFSYLQDPDDLLNARLTFAANQYDKESWAKNGFKDRYFSSNKNLVYDPQVNSMRPILFKHNFFRMSDKDYVFMGLTEEEKLALINKGVTDRPTAYRHVDMIFKNVDFRWQKWILEERFNFDLETIGVRSDYELKSLFSSMKKEFDADMSLEIFMRGLWNIDKLELDEAEFPKSPDGSQFFAQNNKREEVRLLVMETLLEPRLVTRFNALAESGAGREKRKKIISENNFNKAVLLLKS